MRSLRWILSFPAALVGFLITFVLTFYLWSAFGGHNGVDNTWFVALSIICGTLLGCKIAPREKRQLTSWFIVSAFGAVVLVGLVVEFADRTTIIQNVQQLAGVILGGGIAIRGVSRSRKASSQQGVMLTSN